MKKALMVYLFVLVMVPLVAQKNGVIMKLSSSDFKEGGFLPSKFAYEHENISPALSWSGVPKGTKSFSIVCDDPDASRGSWIHWILWDIPGETLSLESGIPGDGTLANGSRQAGNDFGEIGWGGPCPSSGTHRYIFKIYALDALLGDRGSMDKKELLKQVKEHMLAEGVLIGKYKAE